MDQAKQAPLSPPMTGNGYLQTYPGLLKHVCFAPETRHQKLGGDLLTPDMPTALARAKRQRADRRPPGRDRRVAAHDRHAPAETLQGAAVKLRRLGAYVEEGKPARLLAGALRAVESAAG